MTRFVQRNGHMVSLERAALIDAANGIEADVPTTAPAAPVRVEQNFQSQEKAELTRAQKAAATRLANKQAKEAALLAAKVEPLRPRNIDPATGEEVVLKEVLAEDGKTIVQVPVEATGETEDGEDPFDAAVDAADAAVVGATGISDTEVEAAALADA